MAYRSVQEYSIANVDRMRHYSARSTRPHHAALNFLLAFREGIGRRDFLFPKRAIWEPALEERVARFSRSEIHGRIGGE